MLMRNSISSSGRFLIIPFLVVCLVLLALPAFGAEEAKPNPPPPAPGAAAAAPASPAAPAASQPAPAPAPKPIARPAASNVNPITEAVVKAGVLACVSRINQVVTFLTANVKSSAYLFLPQKQPDQSLFSVSLSLEDSKTTRYTSASFAPTTNGQCAAVYDTVEYVAMSCSDVETKALKNLKRKGVLGKDIVMLDGGSVTIFLMPAGSGCVVIKKQVVQ